MQYTAEYKSKLGDITLAADEIGLIGLWFYGQKFFARNLDKENKKKELPVFKQAKKWLDIYFSQKEPNFTPPLHLIGSEFQKEVWQILSEIPYGKTITYGDIASKIASKRGLIKMSSQAVGSAIGYNPISIIIPCHRVVGKNGNLSGYAGGIDRKIKLLKIEKGYKDTFFIPE